MNIKEYIEESIKIKSTILNDDELCSRVEKTADCIINAYKNHNKVLIAGNGGSAADSQHMATELVGRFYKTRSPLAAIALTTDSSILTAISNDCGFNEVFSRQIEALGTEGDIFIAISTSGTSDNIIQAIMTAKNKGLTVIGLSGQNVSQMSELCDIMIQVPSSDTPKIQEIHLMIEHIICSIVEKTLFN